MSMSMSMSMTRHDDDEEEEVTRRRDDEDHQNKIQSLFSDNQRLAATNFSLKQDLALTQLHLHKLSAASNDVKSQRDSEVRRVYEQSLKVEADLRLLNLINADLNQLLQDKQDNLNLTHQLHTIQTDLDKARPQLDRLPRLEDELKTMRTDIQTGRAAIEFEKKTRTSNLEHQKTMEDNITIMSHHIHKLRTRLANAYLLTPTPGAASNYTGTGTGGAGYINPPPPPTHPPPPPPPPPYDTANTNTNALALPPHQIQAGADGTCQHGHVISQNGSIGMQLPNLQT